MLTGLMKTGVLVFIIIVFLPISGFSEIVTPEKESNYANRRDSTRLKAIGSIPEKLESYGNLIGCQFNMNPDNIVESPEGNHNLIAFFTVDVGCSGGSSMSRPVFVELELGSDMQYYISMDRSAPDKTSDEIPGKVTSIYIKENKVWYTAYEHDWSKDSICCPSIKNTAELKFVNNMWVGIKVKSPDNDIEVIPENLLLESHNSSY